MKALTSTSVRHCSFLLLCAVTLIAHVSSPQRERLSLDRGWFFHAGDIPFPVVSGHQMSYNNEKAGSSKGAASPGLDDSSWTQLDLPHDWALEQPFDPRANISQGCRFAICRARFTPRPAVQKSGGELILRNVVGKTQVWIDGKLTLEKSDKERSGLTIPFGAGDGERTISVLMEASSANARAGLSGEVTVE